LWPTLVEICYFQKDRKGLPQVRVMNQKKRIADCGLQAGGGQAEGAARSFNP
jgi:hypothetical protein